MCSVILHGAAATLHIRYFTSEGAESYRRCSVILFGAAATLHPRYITKNERVNSYPKNKKTKTKKTKKRKRQRR